MKKIILIMICLVWCSSSYSMKKEEESWATIFYRQYPNLCKLFENTVHVAGGVGMVYALEPLVEALDNSNVIKGALLVLGVGSLYDGYFKKPDVIESIQTCPSDLLHYNNTIQTMAHSVSPKLIFPKSLHKNWIENNDISVEWMRDNMNFFGNNFSELFCLIECDASHCPLSRSVQPEYRNMYENTLVRMLTKKMKCASDRIDYVEFAHGGLFQTLVTITKTLLKKPQARLSLHLIDTENRMYTDLCDVLKNGRQVTKKFKGDEEKVFDKWIEKRTQSGDFQVSKEEAKLILRKKLLQYQGILNQFVSFFKKYFPQSDVSVFMYKSAQDYLNYVENDTIPVPDVVAACDLQDQNCENKKAMQDYIFLCLSCLEHNHKSENLLLAYEGEPLLWRCFLNRITTENSAKDQFKGYKKVAQNFSIHDSNKNYVIPFYFHHKELKINWLGKKI